MSEKTGFEKFSQKQTYGGRVAIATPAAREETPKQGSAPIGRAEPAVQQQAAVQQPTETRPEAPARRGRPSEGKKEQIHITVTPALKARLEEFMARNYRKNITDVVTQAIVEFLENHG